jgi:two-component system LytT family response regulator
VTTLRVLIADDEPPARKRLERLLHDQPDVRCVGEAADGVTALEEIERLAPDLVLLDVQMPELDGLGVAAALGEDGPAIVFTTAHEAHAVRAFELAAVDFLLKPISKERLRASLDRVKKTREKKDGTPAAELARAVLERLRDAERAARSGANFAGGAGGGTPPALGPTPTRKMAVRCGIKYVVFDVSRVVAVLAQDHYAAIHVDGRELLSDESLDGIMTRLDPAMFLRVHRSAIVNVERIKELEQEGERKYVAVLSDAASTRVPIARDRLEEVKMRLGV